MSLILIERTTISDEAVLYLQEVESRFKGNLSRGFMEHDYLTAPSKEPWIKGMDDCSRENLIIRADDGSEGSYIMYKISDQGYKVLEKANKNGRR